MLGEVLGVGVEEAHHLPLEHRQGPPEGVSLAEHRPLPRQQLRLLEDWAPAAAATFGGAVAGGRVDHHDLVEHASLAQRHQPLDDRPDGRGALAGGEAHRHAPAALGGDPLGCEARVMKGPSVRKALAGGACHRLYYLNSLALDRTIEPWSALLDAGRSDGRLVREANEGPERGTR